MLEVTAPKPGNVSPGRDFGEMTFADLVRSAIALGSALAADRARARGVGALILDGVRATAAVTQANTNLGIALLLAPMARAAATAEPGQPLRTAVVRTLETLTVEDARLAFSAIVLASPGGLGTAGEHDVREPATVTLREAMAAAADRDAIASEYATGYELVFTRGLPLLTAALDAGAPTLDAIVNLHVALLAERPDTLIARKHGLDAARAVTELAREVSDGRRTVAQLDAELRDPARRLNPGATADLVAATLFAALETGVRLP